MSVATLVPVASKNKKNSNEDLLNQRHRITQRAVPSLSESQGSFPHRASRTQMPLPDRSVFRPDRARSSTVDNQMETRPQRVRHHLRRPLARREGILEIKNASCTLTEIVPAASLVAPANSIQSSRDLDLQDA